MSQKILKLPQVMEMTGLSRSSLYAAISAKTFPRQIRLGVRAIGFLESEVSDWISQRAELRGAK